MRGLALATGIGSQFAILVSFGALAGNHLAEKLDKSWITAFGITLGSVVAFVNMFVLLRRFERKDRAGKK